jgi:hypothetical protein
MYYFWIVLSTTQQGMMTTNLLVVCRPINDFDKVLTFCRMVIHDPPSKLCRMTLSYLFLYLFQINHYFTLLIIFISFVLDTEIFNSITS